MREIYFPGVKPPAGVMFSYAHTDLKKKKKVTATSTCTLYLTYTDSVLRVDEEKGTLWEPSCGLSPC